MPALVTIDMQLLENGSVSNFKTSRPASLERLGRSRIHLYDIIISKDIYGGNLFRPTSKTYE
jgi:hypothetical protein